MSGFYNILSVFLTREVLIWPCVITCQVDSTIIKDFNQEMPFPTQPTKLNTII